MAKAKRYVILDRDGVINRNPQYLDYIRKPVQFRLLPGVRRALKMLGAAGFKMAVISNQAGVGKGLFSKDDLDAINRKMLRQLKAFGVRISKTCYCIHDPQENCACRKPNTGLLNIAIGRDSVDLHNSFFVGDTERDAVTGHRFGIKTIAVLSGYADTKAIRKWSIQPDFITKDLLSAVRDIILKI